MGRFYPLSLEELEDGEMKGIEIDGNKILIIKSGPSIYAYENRCAHQNIALSEGILENNILTCGAHFWEYDISTGKSIDYPHVQLKSYPVKRENGQIGIEI